MNSGGERLTPMQENPWKDPRFMISMVIIAGFAVAYLHKPDDTMNGALIAAFAGAWGYWLGSSSGARESRTIIENAQAQTSQAIELVNKTQPEPEKPDLTVPPGGKVTIAAEEPAAEPPPPKPPAAGATLPDAPPWAS